MKALAWKELREVWWIALAALFGYMALLVSLTGSRAFFWVPGLPQPEDVPFVRGGFAGGATIISLAFAVALGFRQTVWESSRGTYLFLLHRPMRREAIFLTKLAVGWSVFLLCASVPVLLYGIWAALPASHAGPFEWAMTESAWRLVLLMPLVYLGSFLSGLRPARWFGTRLLPLSASLTLLFLMIQLPVWWALGLPLVLALAGLLAWNICFTARMRDYA